MKQYAVNGTFIYFIVHVHQEKPGFTAYVDGSFDAPGTIILPHVYSNIGSLFDPNTSVFTADRTGLYGFYLGIECVDIGTKIVNLVRDGSLIGHAVCFPQSGVPSYGSSFSVQHIEKGSKVWAKDSYDGGSKRIGLTWRKNNLIRISDFQLTRIIQKS